MDAKQAPGGWRLARPRLAESSVPGSLAGATSRGTLSKSGAVADVAGRKSKVASGPIQDKVADVMPALAMMKRMVP